MLYHQLLLNHIVNMINDHVLSSFPLHN